jgi:hypothetical protein
MNYFKNLLLAIFISLLSSCWSVNKSKNSIEKSLHEKDYLRHDIFPKVCKQGLYEGPNRKFAVYVFCDDALGTNIGIINTSSAAFAGPGSKKVWSVDTRFWQEARFSRDVRNIEWSPNGEKITVETQDIYGTGKTYVIDLINKRIEKEGPSMQDFGVKN